MAAQVNVEPRNIRWHKTGWLLTVLLSMAFADGCSPASEDSSGRQASARTALVASVPPQDGQAFHIGVFVAADENKAIQDALQQAGEANHLELDVQPFSADTASQTAPLDHRQPRRVDALLICAFKAADIQPLLRNAAEKQMPVVVVEWIKASLSALPANPPAAPIPAASGRKQIVSRPAQSVTPLPTDTSGRRGALLTLLHNGKSARQMLEVTPEDLSVTAVTTLSAYLRGEKLEPARNIKPPTY